MLALVWLRSGPRPSSVSGFEAAEALDVLTRVLGERPGPRPVGSPAHDETRERIVATLRALGLRPEVQDTTSCANGTCARVRNITAHVAGPEERRVLLVAHYDSVDAGPGIADDAHGVAILLEAARLSRVRAPHNGLAVLFTDAEEIGLLGAQAFVRDHPWADDVAAVVNVEARGTGGRSWLFETSEPNGWITRLAETTGTRPAMTSVAFEIYRRMPNDTDFTVFRNDGIPGVNFAFIDGVQRYHTPLDDLAHLDLRSVQQQGDQAIATWWALGDLDLAGVPEGNDVYGDVLGFTVVRWPESVAFGAALAVVAGVLGCTGAALRTRRTRLREVLVALVGTGAQLAAVVAGSVGLQLALDAAGAGFGVQAPFRWGVWLLVSGAFVAPLVGWARMDDASRWIGAWTWLALGGVALAWFAPGASYLFVLPTGWAIVFFAAWLGVRGEAWPWMVAGSAVLLAIWLELALVLESALALVAPIIAVPLAVAWLGVLPALSIQGRPYRFATAGLVGLGLVGTLASLGLPAATVETPSRTSFTYVQDGGRAQWLALAAEPPAGFTTAAPIARLPWLGRYGRDADSIDLAAPTARWDAGRLTVASPRGARTFGLSLPESTRMRLDGRPVGHRSVVLFHGFDELTVDLDDPAGVRPFDVAPLGTLAPPPRSPSRIPSQWGDRTFVLGEPLRPR